jgi:hypothetical protein
MSELTTTMSNQGAAAAGCEESSATADDSLEVVPSIVSLSSDDDDDDTASSLSLGSIDAKDDVSVEPHAHFNTGQREHRVLFAAFWSATRRGVVSQAPAAAPPREEHQQQYLQQCCAAVVVSDAWSQDSMWAWFEQGVVANDKGPTFITNNDESSTTTTTGSQYRRHGRHIFPVTMLSPWAPCSWKPRIQPLHRKRSVSDTSCLYAPTTPVSCLRRSRYAVAVVVGGGGGFHREDSNQSLTGESASVSFDDHVEIVTYEPPIEHWAGDEWMDYFA